MPATMHPHKRPYAGSQPHITSYFQASSSSTLNQPSLQEFQDNVTAPLASRHSEEGAFAVKLPHTVQSNLLNVGMRVRKSVPEGYKVGTPYSSYTLFSPSSFTHTPAQSLPQSHQTDPPKQPRTRPRAGIRELTPFCGSAILKVGGWANQSWSGCDSTSSAIFDEEDEDDEVPCLSQGSTASNISMDIEETVYGGRNKRRFSEEADEDNGFSMGREFFAEASKIPEKSQRVLAVPRRKRFAGKMEHAVDGEPVVIKAEDDFQEAEFLDYGLREVEMTG